jgi:hypothetical protein
MTIEELCKKLKEILKLSFTLEEWQAHIIQRVRQGYDSIFLAGTGDVLCSDLILQNNKITKCEGG